MAKQHIKSNQTKRFGVKVLNEAGTALVDLYDLGAEGVKSLFSFSKKTTSILPEKTKKFVKKSVGYIYPDESKTIRDRIKIKEEKIEKLYKEIGKQEATQLDTGKKKDSNASKNIKNLFTDVKNYESQIKKLEGKVTEIEREKQEAREEKIKREKEKKEAKILAKLRNKKTNGLVAHDAIIMAIKDSLKTFTFESSSEKSKFEKVANDLLSTDRELRLLAVNELAKMKNEAAVPVIIEAVKIGDPNLTSELINALISIGNVSAVPLFKDKLNDSNYRIRVACLRGIYKLAGDDDESLKLLAKAIKDEHPEVRKSAITYIGWKDNAEALPALVQSLRDENNDVKKAALSALATIRDKTTALPIIRVLQDEDLDIRQNALDAVKMITGEDIVFDIQADEEALQSSVENLIEWWQKKRTGEAELEESEVMLDTVDYFTEADLNQLTKTKLLSICSDNGLDCNSSMNKNEIIQIILNSSS